MDDVVDLAEAHGVLASEVARFAEEARDTLVRNASPLLAAAGDGEGLSFFDLKNLSMLQYLGDLALVALRKARGLHLRDGAGRDADDHLGRIVEARTVLEKLRPVEKKLRHEVDKYLRIADSGGNLRPDDPARFRPDLEALASDEDDDDDDGHDDGEGDDRGPPADGGRRKYVVPKNVPMALPDEDQNGDEVAENGGRAARKRTLSRAILDDLKRQHLDVPEEEFHQSVAMKARHVAEMKERTRYEEDNFLRLPALSKRERRQRTQQRSLTTMGSLGDEITDFGVSRFSEEGGRARKNSPSKKRTSSSKKSKGGGGKKFRKRQ